MNRIEALDWLARNIDEWHVYDEAIGYSGYKFTETEWLRRRSELQGKPCWGEVLDLHRWAKWIAQSPLGQWECFEVEPRALESNYWAGNLERRQACVDYSKFKGEVIGDWRDTLESRPIPDVCDKESYDEVNNPTHYDLFPGQQSIDIIKAALTPEEWAGFLKGNIIKYRLRAGKKGPAEKCLAKADWYQSKLWE